MENSQSQFEADRKLLLESQSKGIGATIKTYFKLSGPGWLQSASTLGGGSLAGALFLGVIGGYSMLWVQLFAMIMGVVMLSAISYVTLSTGESPFQGIKINFIFRIIQAGIQVGTPFFKTVCLGQTFDWGMPPPIWDQA